MANEQQKPTAQARVGKAAEDQAKMEQRTAKAVNATVDASIEKTQELAKSVQQNTNKETGRDDRTNYDKAPNSPVPNDLVTHDPTRAPGQTNLDPLGVRSTTAIADPTDTRALGKLSDSGVTADNVGRNEKERPTMSPSFAGQKVGATGVLGVADAEGKIPGTKVEYVEDARVRLKTNHYLNDVLYEAGAVIDGYTGPINPDMQVLD